MAKVKLAGGFPKVLYIAWVDELDEPWMGVFETPEAVAEIGKTRRVGIYELRNVASVSTVVEIE